MAVVVVLLEEENYARYFRCYVEQATFERRWPLASVGDDGGDDGVDKQTVAVVVALDSSTRN